MLELILHAPAVLETFAAEHGNWVYALLSGIIFAEVCGNFLVKHMSCKL